MQALGAPWCFGSDQPAALFETWEEVVTDAAVAGNEWNRWPFPAAPAGVRDMPRGYFIEATKR